MKTTPLRFLSALAFSVLSALGAVAAAPAKTIAFVDVTVIPMDSERTLPRHTVIVRGDRITQVGPTASVQVPADAQRIDGRGKFLLPGLGEMHGHNPPLGSSQEFIESVYFLFLANGVTTVRSMLGWDGQLALRDKVNRGEMVGPTLYLAGPSFTGSGPSAVTTPEAAAAKVRAQKAEGWDLLKVHPGLKREVYDAMAATAKELKIEFAGHIPADVGIVHAIKSGQRTVDHLDGYIEYLQGDRGPLERAKLDEVVKLTRDTGTWVVPTMVLWESIIGSQKPETLAAFPELRYMPRATVEGWKSNYARRVGAAEFDHAKAARIADNRRVLLKALADGGVKIIFGTDAPQIFSVPGFSIHRELQAMKAAGLSNFAILQSATKNVGDYLAARDKFGTIAADRRADLLLLDANPLSDVAHVAKRSGVMYRGRWLPESEIQAGLAKIAEASAK